MEKKVRLTLFCVTVILVFMITKTFCLLLGNSATQLKIYSGVFNVRRLPCGSGSNSKLA